MVYNTDLPSWKCDYAEYTSYPSCNCVTGPHWEQREDCTRPLASFSNDIDTNSFTVIYCAEGDSLYAREYKFDDWQLTQGTFEIDSENAGAIYSDDAMVSVVFASISNDKYIWYNYTETEWRISNEIGGDNIYTTCKQQNIFECDTENGDGFTFNTQCGKTREPTVNPTFSPTTIEQYPDDLEIEAWEASGHYYGID